MEHTVAGAIKEWRKHNKVIGQVKISYKKFLRKCRELSLAGGKYREYQGLCAKYQCARLTAVTKGLVPFEDKPFKAYLNKRLSKRRKLDIAHGSLNFIEKTFHPDVLPQLYNVADFGREMFSIPLKNGDKLDVKLLASPFQEEGELMLQLFLGDRRVYSVCFSCTCCHLNQCTGFVLAERNFEVFYCSCLTVAKASRVKSGKGFEAIAQW